MVESESGFQGAEVSQIWCVSSVETDLYPSIQGLPVRGRLLWWESYHGIDLHDLQEGSLSARSHIYLVQRKAGG